jgi:soluble lytic murein transglycosylase-like protein
MHKVIWVSTFLSILSYSFAYIEPEVKEPNVCGEGFWVEQPDQVSLIKQSIFYKILLIKHGQGMEGIKDIVEAVYRTSKKQRVDPDIVLSIIRIESNFNPAAHSYAGAIGLMQVMPLWAKPGAACAGYDLFDISENIDCGVSVYLTYLKAYRGNLKIALAAYNRGPGRVNEDLNAGRTPINGYVSTFKRVEHRLNDVSSLDDYGREYAVADSK